MHQNAHIFGALSLPKGRYPLPFDQNGRQVYLTQKEAIIVTRLMDGQRTKQIAWDLNSSLHTVNTHLANIKEKLDCENIFQLGLKLGAVQQQTAS